MVDMRNWLGLRSMENREFQPAFVETRDGPRYD